MSSNTASSSSAPISWADRQATYNAAMGVLGDYLPEDSYQPVEGLDDRQGAGFTEAQPFESAGDYRGPGAFNSFGNYDDLEQSIVQSRTAPLRDFEGRERERVNQDASDRGIWSSGLAMQAQDDVTRSLAPQYEMAGAEAATQRYGLEGDELARRNAFNMQGSDMANQYAMAQAGARNTYGAAEADRANQFALSEAGATDQYNLANQQLNIQQQMEQYASQWRPADYLSGIWNNTGGTISSGSSGGWSI